MTRPIAGSALLLGALVLTSCSGPTPTPRTRRTAAPEPAAEPEAPAPQIDALGHDTELARAVHAAVAAYHAASEGRTEPIEIAGVTLTSPRMQEHVTAPGEVIGRSRPDVVLVGMLTGQIDLPSGRAIVSVGLANGAAWIAGYNPPTPRFPLPSQGVAFAPFAELVRAHCGESAVSAPSSVRFVSHRLREVYEPLAFDPSAGAPSLECPEGAEIRVTDVGATFLDGDGRVMRITVMLGESAIALRRVPAAGPAAATNRITQLRTSSASEVEPLVRWVEALLSGHERPRGVFDLGPLAQAYPIVYMAHHERLGELACEALHVGLEPSGASTALELLYTADGVRIVAAGTAEPSSTEQHALDGPLAARATEAYRALSGELPASWLVTEDEHPTAEALVRRHFGVHVAEAAELRGATSGEPPEGWIITRFTMLLRPVGGGEALHVVGNRNSGPAVIVHPAGSQE